jgi:hypothetical protein
MKQFLSALTLMLVSGLAWAATREIEGATAPAETVDVIYVVIFVIGFVASIVGFFVYLYWNDRKHKSDPK